MGSTGSVLELVSIRGARALSRGYVRLAALRWLEAAWRDLLPRPAFRTAWGWVSQGESSLLVVGVPDGDRPGKVKELPFELDLSVSWAAELARHWLEIALVRARPALETALAACGYALGEDSWYPREARHRFVARGKRVGHVVEAGVDWQLPEVAHDADADLPADLRLAVASVRAGGACQCPACARPSSRP